MSSTTVQTELSFPPHTFWALAEGATENMRGSKTALASTGQHFDAGVQRPSTPQTCTAPDLLPELDTTFRSTRYVALIGAFTDTCSTAGIFTVRHTEGLDKVMVTPRNSLPYIYC